VAGKKHVTISAFVKEKLTTLSVPLTSKPVKVTIDPGADLLYEGNVREIR
jgi:hypothetical protein